MDTTRTNGNNRRKTHQKRRDIGPPLKHRQEGDPRRVQLVAKKGKAQTEN